MITKKIENENSTIELYEDFFVDSYFSVLMETLNWKQEYITIFGKTNPTPRLQAWYGDAGVFYKYSGINLQHNHWTKELLEIKELIEKKFNTSFNGALINLYRNGSDYSSWHSDNEVSLGQNIDIYSVSFGAERFFSLKHNSKNLKEKILLRDKSLLIMRAPTQEFWKHQLGKTSTKVRPRINITFRRIYD